MLRGIPALHLFLWNVMIITAWHVVVFVACVKLPMSTFDAAKSRYQPKSWEHNGRIYRDKLKIQLWKDKVPQHIGKDGFSKEHLTDMTLPYLEEFIMETCRGEWMHLNNCLCSVVVILINPLVPGLILCFLILLGNLPFAIIQRYNRFRLNTLRRKLIRDMRDGRIPSEGRVTA